MPLVPDTLGAAQIRQIDNESTRNDIATDLFDESDGRRGGAAGSNQIVHEQHFLAFQNGIVMHLNPISASTRSVPYSNS